MHTQLWSKYLPIIKILLKKAVAADQNLQLNVTDFERAGIARKSGNKFSFSFNNGRADAVIASDLARDLVYILLQDKAAKEIFMQNDYVISLNTKYQLSINFTGKNNVTTEPDMVAAAETEVAL
jgi:hypothetical protein